MKATGISLMMLSTLGAVALLACPPTPSPVATADDVGKTAPSASETTAPAPTPSTTASAAPSTSASYVATPLPLPTLDTTCASDAECIVFDEATTGKYACCLFGNGCVLNVANNTSLMRFRAACKSTPPASCPPIGCAQPASPKAKCTAGKCVLVK